MRITFDQLTYASRCCHDICPYLALIFEWAAKREHVALYLHDLPSLLKAYSERATQIHPTNPNAVLIDPYPGVRLATACEGLAHCVYAMAEIAASVGNKASNGAIPSSFNQLCSKVRSGKLDNELTKQLPDLDWYARVRELRTEWCHHSSIFIGRDGGDPILCVNCYRRPGDQVIFKGRLQIRPTELMNWSERATLAIDGFGSAIFYQFILPKMPLDAMIFCPSIDHLGFPKMTSDGRLIGERIPLRQYLSRGGIDVPA